MIAQNPPSRQLRRKNEREKKKALHASKKLEEHIYCKVRHLLNNVFTEDKINAIAKKSKICSRNRKLKPLIIISILMIGCFNDIYSDPLPSLERLCLILKNRFKITIKKQSLQEKINRKETVEFIKYIVQETLRYEANKLLKNLFKKSKLNIRIFSRILIQDSTVISLPENLQKLFRGCGGAASEAAVKCDFVIDICRNLIMRVRLVAGRVPDASLSKDLLNFLEADDLVIRDLGYFNLSQLSLIKAKNAYFISRLSLTANVYLNETDENCIDLVKHVKSLNIDKRDIDLEVYLGKKERVLVRLIAMKVPTEVLEARRQKYKNKNKKEPPEYLNIWNGYTFMITNIPKEKLPLKMILKIYKIRWQIELIFKNTKSNICIDKLSGKNKFRILSLIYLKLLITWIIMIIYAYGQEILKDGEVSLVKLTKWLKDESKLKNAFLTGDFSKLLKEFKRDIDYLRMEKKRKRQTTASYIEEKYEHFLMVKVA